MERDFYISLIIKKLKAELSSEEAAELNAWLSKDPANEALEKQMHADWQLSEKATKEIEVDLSGDFAKFKSRMDHAKNKNTSAKVRSLKRIRIWSAAAAALLLIAVFWFIQDGNSPSIITVSAGEEIKDVRLPDGSLVALNVNSTISYTADFAHENRSLDLYGEGYFEVVKNTEMPFEVHLGKAVVRVLGTKFNVRESPELIALTVDEGLVAFIDKEKEQSIQVSKSQSATFDQTTNTLNLTTKYQANASAWKSEALSFANVPLSEVLKDIETYFGVKVKVENIELMNCSFAGYFPKANVQQVIEDVSNAFDMVWSQDNDQNYLLTGGQCNE